MLRNVGNGEKYINPKGYLGSGVFVKKWRREHD